jgi:hypothetical protein
MIHKADHDEAFRKVSFYTFQACDLQSARLHRGVQTMLDIHTECGCQVIGRHMGCGTWPSRDDLLVVILPEQKDVQSDSKNRYGNCLGVEIVLQMMTAARLRRSVWAVPVPGFSFALHLDRCRNANVLPIGKPAGGYTPWAEPYTELGNVAAARRRALLRTACCW